MPSPFPGMDPWLESPGVFPDFHNSFIAYLRAALNAVLPPPYFAAIGTRVVITGGERDQFVEPDVDVLRPFGSETDGGTALATKTTVEADPLIIEVERDEVTEWFLEVRTGEGDNELITSIELLSISNKLGGSASRGAYLLKQREMIERGVNLVEIDLLRRGTHTTLVPYHSLSVRARYHYHVCIYRPAQPRRFETYPIQLSQPLPAINIPLKEIGEQVTISLQPIHERCYAEGAYDRRINYHHECVPSLTSSDAAWASVFLAPMSHDNRKDSNA